MGTLTYNGSALTFNGSVLTYLGSAPSGNLGGGFSNYNEVDCLRALVGFLNSNANGAGLNELACLRIIVAHMRGGAEGRSVATMNEVDCLREMVALVGGSGVPELYRLNELDCLRWLVVNFRAGADGRYVSTMNELDCLRELVGQASAEGVFPPSALDPDIISYADLLLANGGSDIRANGEIVYLNNTLKSPEYNAMGRPDLWLLRADQNMSTGSTVYSVQGRTGTLVNGPTWGANGILFSSGSQQYISVSYPSALTYGAVGQLPGWLLGSPDAPSMLFGGFNSTDYRHNYFADDLTVAISSPGDGTYRHGSITHRATSRDLYLNGANVGSSASSQKPASNNYRIGEGQGVVWQNGVISVAYFGAAEVSDAQMAAFHAVLTAQICHGIPVA